MTAINTSFSNVSGAILSRICCPAYIPSTTGNIAAVETETSSQLNWRLAVRRIAATTHAKLSGAAHARRVAGAPIARAQRFDPARAVRLAGIVPLLRPSLAAGSAHAAATTRGRAVGGFGASRRSSPRRCGRSGAGSSASSRCNAARGQAAAEALALGRPIRYLGVV